jgi:hypothetical protein
VFTLVGAISFVGAVLIYPGWSLARRKNRELSSWPLLLPLAGTGLWVVLNESGIGVPGMRNVPEMLGVLIVAVIVAYFQFFYFNRRFGGRPIGLILSFAIVAVVTLVFRLVTPQL